MHKLLIMFSVIFLLLTIISASCEEGQIDINSASEEELTGITHIGPSRAEQIIALRPFDSVDDMIRISGIGEIYLANILAEGLACVNGQEEEEEVEEESDEEKVNEEPQEIKSISKEPEPIELQTINLNPQVIKSEDDNENLGKSNYAIYGFVAFCILIGILFIIKNRKHKNEFR